MTINEFREILEGREDKVSVFLDDELIGKLKATEEEEIEVMNEFLSDEEKIQVFLPENIEYLDSKSKKNFLKALKNTEIVKRYFKYLNLNMDKDLLEDLWNTFSSSLQEEIISELKGDKALTSFLLDKSDKDLKLKFLSIDFDIGKIGLNPEDKKELINRLDNKTKEEIFLNPDIRKKIHLSEIVQSIIKDNLSSEIKEKIIFDPDYLKEIQLSNYEVMEIVKKSTPEIKKRFFQDKSTYQRFGISEEKIPLKLFDYSCDIFCDFYEKNEDFRKNAFKTMELNKHFEILEELAKRNVELPKITIQKFDEKERKKFIEICKKYPNIQVYDDLYLGTSSGKEYIEGEAWIKSVIDKIKPEYGDLLKVAMIDYEIGKRIAYSPDFHTENRPADDKGVRALWKIISTGYGICSGIANIEKYILDRVGIKSEIVYGERHAFLKVNDIEIPKTKDEKVRGNTILDPTWNLSENRFNLLPCCFFKSYDEMRKQDITNDGIDKKAHFNDKKLSDAKLSITPEVLNAVFQVICGNRKNDFQKTYDYFYYANYIHNEYCEERNFKELELQLKWFSRIYPDFSKYQLETISFLSANLFQKYNMGLTRTIIDRVYEKDDIDKKPHMYVYVENEEKEKMVYVSNLKEANFEKITLKEFEEKYSCYEKDLEKNNGIAPWRKEKESIITKNHDKKQKEREEVEI